MNQLVLGFAVFGLTVISSFANAGSHPCDVNQAQWEADATLKLSYNGHTIVRSYARGSWPLPGHLPAEWTITFVAIPKDPKYTKVGSYIGDMKIRVLADGTCGVADARSSSAEIFETPDVYTQKDELRDVQSRVPNHY